MIEEELVTAGGAKLAVPEENTNLGSRPVGVVGVNFDNYRHLMRGIPLKGDVIDDRLVLTDPGPLVDGPVDDILGDALGPRFFKRGKEAGIRGRIGTTMAGGNGDFPDEFARGLGLFKRGDLALGEEPLTTHGRKKLKVKGQKVFSG